MFLFNSKSTGYESVAKIEGLTLGAGKKFGTLLIETDGTISADAVYASYEKTLDQLLAFDPKVSAKLDVIQHIVVLPQSFLCKPALYPGPLPKDCSTARSEPTFGKADSATGKAVYTHMLLIGNDPATLGDAMKAGVASAVCVFQPDDLATDLVDKICDMTKRFAPTEPAPR
jgi:hypothetical protein